MMCSYTLTAQMFLIKRPPEHTQHSHLKRHSGPCNRSDSVPSSGCPFSLSIRAPRAANCARRREREAPRPQGNFGSILLPLPRLETTSPSRCSKADLTSPSGTVYIQPFFSLPCAAARCNCLCWKSAVPHVPITRNHVCFLDYYM